AELRNGKIFVATQDGVKVFRARDPVAQATDAPACTVGGFADYTGVETSSGGVIALTYAGNTNGKGCSFPIYPYLTQLTTSAGDTSVPGVTRLSASGRFAVTYLP